MGRCMSGRKALNTICRSVPARIYDIVYKQKTHTKSVSLFSEQKNCWCYRRKTPESKHIVRPCCSPCSQSTPNTRKYQQ
jgi:hypothetical protein